MIRLKPLMALLLALSLMLGSVVQAVAHSEMAGATDQTLCGAAGATLLLDASGQPLPSRHACPHCLAAGLAATMPPHSPTPEPARRLVSIPHRPYLAMWQPRPGQTPSARGPPLSV